MPGLGLPRQPRLGGRKRSLLIRGWEDIWAGHRTGCLAVTALGHPPMPGVQLLCSSLAQRSFLLGQMLWVQLPGLSLSGCVATSRSPSLSVLQLPPL